MATCPLSCGLCNKGSVTKGSAGASFGSLLANVLVFDVVISFFYVRMVNFVLFMVLAVAMAMVDDGCDVSTPRC